MSSSQRRIVSCEFVCTVNAHIFLKSVVDLHWFNRRCRRRFVSVTNHIEDARIDDAGQHNRRHLGQCDSDPADMRRTGDRPQRMRRVEIRLLSASREMRSSILRFLADVETGWRPRAFWDVCARWLFRFVRRLRTFTGRTHGNAPHLTHCVLTKTISHLGQF